MHTAGTPFFVSACMMMMAPGRDERDTSGNSKASLFTLDQEKKLREFGAKTIVKWMEKKDERPFFSVPVDTITNLTHAVQMGLGADAARERATAWVKAHPESAALVIRANKAKGMDMQTGLPIETPFMRQMYDAIVVLVAADDLIEGLTSVYGAEGLPGGKCWKVHAVAVHVALRECSVVFRGVRGHNKGTVWAR